MLLQQQEARTQQVSYISSLPPYCSPQPKQDTIVTVMSAMWLDGEGTVCIL